MDAPEQPDPLAVDGPRCVVVGCTRPMQVKKHGLCFAHGKRYQRHGQLGIGRPWIKPRRVLPPFTQSPTRRKKP